MAMLERHMDVATALGIDEAFERGSRRGEDDRELAERSHHHRHVARVVGHAVLLFVGLLVLLIDNDEAGLGPGQEQRRARADHDLCRAVRHSAPHPLALAHLHSGMPGGRRHAEAPLDAGEKGLRQGDLGHQQQHLPT